MQPGTFQFPLLGSLDFTSNDKQPTLQLGSFYEEKLLWPDQKIRELIARLWTWGKPVGLTN